MHAAKGRIPLIRSLITYDASVKTSTNAGVTPLHAAAYWCQDEGETVKLLLKNGADPNSTSSDGSPFGFCCYETRESRERQVSRAKWR